jgi:hypothetical protein
MSTFLCTYDDEALFCVIFFAGTNLVEFQAELRRAKNLMFPLIKFLTFIQKMAVAVSILLLLLLMLLLLLLCQFCCYCLLVYKHGCPQTMAQGRGSQNFLRKLLKIFVTSSL